MNMKWRFLHLDLLWYWIGVAATVDLNILQVALLASEE